MKWSALLFASLVVAAAPSTARADEVVTQCVEAFDEAQKLTRAGKLLAARDKLDLCSAPTCHAAVRSDCLEQRHDVDRAIPTVTFTVRDGAGQDVDATLSVDGRVVDLSAGRAVALDPGTHEIAFARRGAPLQQVRARVTVAEGEKSRPLAFVVKGDEPALTTREADKPSSGAGPWPWVLAGAGGLFVVGAGALQVLALGKDSEAKALERDLKGPVDCTTVSPSTSTNGTTCGSLLESRDSKKDAARANQTGAIVTGVLGLGMIAGGVVWLIATTPKPSTAARLVPLVGTTNGAALTGSF